MAIRAARSLLRNVTSVSLVAHTSVPDPDCTPSRRRQPFANGKGETGDASG
jgi:hypothetical protein